MRTRVLYSLFYFAEASRASGTETSTETTTETTMETTVLVQDEPKSRVKEPWLVILFNDEIHTFEEVIIQIVKATGCPMSNAEAYAWQVHLDGKACVFDGGFERCLRVQGVLKEIALVTEVQG